MMNSDAIDALVDQELKGITDAKLAERIAGLRVKPHCVERAWDYGEDGLTYPCWTILEHGDSNTGIAYCNEGFGPSSPWGLVSLSGPDMNIGMDCQWWESLMIAVRVSAAWRDQ